MEKTFEQVQAENAKLNERLKNAIQVFKQQKEEITRVTTERDSYKAQLVEKDTVISGLEARIAEAGNSDQKFFEQLEEINKLTENIENLDASLTSTTEQLNNTESALEEANSTISDRDAQIDELSATIESNNTTIASLRKQVSDRNADIKGITDAMIKLATSGKKIADKVEKEEIA